MSLQACPDVILEDIAVLGESRPSGCDSSLNLLALVVVSGAVSLPKGDVAFNVPCMSSVVIYWCFVAVNSLGDTGSACRTPLMVLIFLLSLCFV